MTTFDLCVLGFIPIAIVLILCQFALNDWDIDKVFWEDRK